MMHQRQQVAQAEGDVRQSAAPFLLRAETQQDLRPQSQTSTRSIQDTTQRISQAMNDLQQSHAQKTAEIRVLSSKLQDVQTQSQTQRKSIIELQVCHLLLSWYSSSLSGSLYMSS